MSDLDIDANIPDSRECKDSKFIYPSAGHVVTGNLKVISDSKIHNIVCTDTLPISISTDMGNKLHLH